MRRLHEIKNRARRVLAAAMVITMVLPATPAYAVNYGDAVTITFDFGDSQPGPANTSNGYASSGLTEEGDGKYNAKGKAGNPLSTSGDGFSGFSGVFTTRSIICSLNVRRSRWIAPERAGTSFRM